MFNVDADLSSLETGVWGDFQGSRFRIAHISNKKFQRELARLQQPHAKKLANGTLDPIVNRDILAKAMSVGLILDWEQVINAKKESVPFTKEAVEAALKANPEFRDWVSEFAINLANFRDEEVEELGEG